MNRDDEFDNIPELGSARDEFDQPDIPTLKTNDQPKRASKPQSKQQPKRSQPLVNDSDLPPPPRSDSRLTAWLVILLMVVIGAGGYWGMEHINQLQRQLIEANQRLTGLEGLINATDESASKSGAALQAQLKKFLLDGEQRIKHVDSELAKLWTVSYQRNKPKIAEIDKTVAKLDKLTQQQDKVLKQQQTSVDKAAQQLVSLDKAQTEHRQAIDSLDSQLKLRDQANQELDALQDTQLSALEKQLKAIQQQPPVPESLAQAIKEHEQAIAAINSFRKQANSQLLRLSERIDLLQQPQPISLPAPAAKP